MNPSAVKWKTFIFSIGGEYDGMIIAQMPNDTALTALNFITTPAGNFSKTQVLPLMNSGGQWRRQGVQSPPNTPPTATRQ
jgi:hypothetical protein